MKTILLAVLVLATALAGCAQPTNFDGDATLALVNQIVYSDDGQLRPRTPQHPEHDDTVDWLSGQMTKDGWTVRTDSFTGQDYQNLDRGAVTPYSDNSRYCSGDDKTELPDIAFTNIYGSLAGQGEGHVVLAAHWDSKEDTHAGDGPVPGANDGASGVAVLLQLQRHIGAHELVLPFTLTIALFDGEDGFEDCHPLAGSLWAARTGALGEISQLILLDMVGDADARFVRESQSVASDGALVDAIWEHAASSGMAANFVTKSVAITDDHVPFIEEGVQAVDIIDAGRPATFPPYWHTSEDTPDKLSAQMLGQIGDLMVWLLTNPETQALLQD